MKNKKPNYMLIVACVLFLFIIDLRVWAYRGSDASRCLNKAQELTFSADSISGIINNIKELNNEEQNNDGCVFDYYIRDSEAVVFCRKHGSGRNCSMQSSISADSYYNDKYNYTAFYCMVFLISLGFFTSIFQSLKKKK